MRPRMKRLIDSSPLYRLYVVIPSYPKEITTRELSEKMNMSLNSIHVLMQRLNADAPICEDEGRICYSSPKDRKRFLNMINKREKKNEQIMQ